MSTYKFSPNLATAEERRNSLVARDDVLENLLTRVREIDSGAGHCILIGPRGIGKTHLLLVLADIVEGDDELSSRWLVVRFAEEEYGITRLEELLLRIVESIPGSDPESIGRDTDHLLAYIKDYCGTDGKHVLLLMDNIQLYYSQFSNVDIGRLRSILMDDSAFLIVGAAPSYFKQMAGYDEAFYHFFEPINLGELTPDEVEEMLRYRAEMDGAEALAKSLEQCRPQIAAITRLTGGNPRLILMLYHVMCQSGIVNATEAFKRLLDDLTPYFQARMDGLAPQERKVLDTLATMESPSTPTEIAGATGLSPQAVSSQLKRLERSGFVRKIKLVKRKTTRYEVTERLYRMWREMRTESGKARLRFLIQFLSLWYAPSQMLSQTEAILSGLTSATDDQRQDLLLHLDYLKEASSTLLHAGMEAVYSHAEANSLDLARSHLETLGTLADLEECVRRQPDDASAWAERAIRLVLQGQINDAVESCDKAVKLKPDDADVRMRRATVLAVAGRLDESLKDIDMALEIRPDDPAILGTGGALAALAGEYEKALTSYEHATRILPDDADAWLGRSLALAKLGRFDDALQGYDRVVELKPDSFMAWSVRGDVLWEMGRIRGALESFSRAVELNPDYAGGWSNRGAALGTLGRYAEALESLDKALALDSDNAATWSARGLAFNSLGRHAEAIESLDKAVGLRPDSAETWILRGGLLLNLGKYTEALESLDRSIELKPGNEAAWFDRGLVLTQLSRFEEAHENFKEAIRNTPDSPVLWFCLAASLERLGRYDEALDDFRRARELARGHMQVKEGRLVPALSAQAALAESLVSLRKGDTDFAYSSLGAALDLGKEFGEQGFAFPMVNYLRNVIRIGKTEFGEEAINRTVSKLGGHYEQILRPFRIALRYMKTGDLLVLEGLQQEDREIVEAIVRERGSAVTDGP